MLQWFGFKYELPLNRKVVKICYVLSPLGYIAMQLA